MNAKDKPDFTLAVTALCETLGREASEATLYGYWIALMDLPIRKVQAAIAKALRTCKFMPSPSELRELAGEASADDRAVLAWAAVGRAASLGAYKTVDFADPLINATIRTMGGWPALLDRPISEFESFARKDFLKIYASLARSGVTGDICRPLPGLGDQGEFRVMALGGREEVVRLGVVRIGNHGEPEEAGYVEDRGGVQRISAKPALEGNETRKAQ